MLKEIINKNFFDCKNILITGGTGTIGNELKLNFQIIKIIKDFAFL
jgi:FlaA1/EpsC-like NDP-sugar epimerase